MSNEHRVMRFFARVSFVALIDQCTREKQTRLINKRSLSRCQHQEAFNTKRINVSIMFPSIILHDQNTFTEFDE